MADVGKLRQWIDSYGVAVRAGVLTPCLEDEQYIRTLFGLPDAPVEVVADWKEKPTRKPITLNQDPETPDAAG